MSESSPDLADQRASIAGHIDEISRDIGIKGWAVDLNHPDTPVHVELVAGDIVISSFQPQLDREDINEMVGRPAPSQFHFTPEEFDLLLPFVETHGDVPISLRVRETSFPLPYYTTLPTVRQLAQEPRKIRALLAPLRDQAVHLLEFPIEPGAGTLWGHIEIFTIDAGGLVWVSGWMRKGPPVEFGALIVDPDRDRTTAAFALATFDREDLPSDAYGVIGIMSTDWQPRQQAGDIYFYFGRRAEFYMRLANNVSIMAEADFLRHFEHIRERLSGRHITTLQQVFTSAHVWALSTERSVGFSLHTAVDRLLLVPGYGCLMEGWVMSPVKPVSRIALRFGDTVLACDPLSLHWKPRHDLIPSFPAFPALAGRAGFVASFFGTIPETYPSDPILKVIFEDGTSANHVVPRNVISRLGHSATLGDVQALFPAIEYEPFFPDFAAAMRRTAKTMAGEVVSLLPGKTDRAAIFAISPETCDAFYLFDMLRRHLQQGDLPPGLVFVAQRSTARSHAIYLFREFVRTTSIKASLILIDSIFRTLHTVKGTCGFLGLTKLGHVAHAGENVLGRMREGKLKATPATISAILHCVDAIKDIVATIEATGGEGGDDYAWLVAELDVFMTDGAEQAVQAAPAVVPAVMDADSDELQALFDATPGPDLTAPAVPVAAMELHPGTAPAPGPVTARPAKPDAAEAPREASIANQTIRVSIDLLEGLMTTVSELVLSRNQLLQLLRNEKDSPFSAPLQRLSMITSELQESVMKTRMQPIGNAWSSLPRIIRDLAHELGKKIELTMEGADTELDRQVLELIKDPLTHMVRNAADHGLEGPDVRAAAGKLPTGRIHLTAFHEGGHIVIQIADDGKGLDAARIRAKAIQNGLATEAEAAAMTDAAIYRFVLRPGFSTAAQVTAISGRGVGMDVVRTNIERIGGTIDIDSQPGHGSTFTIKIPLTLAIVPALIVGCAGERFAIPQISVVELVRASDSGENRIEQISDSAVLRLRDRLLPLVDLQALLGLPPSNTPSEERLVIVTQVGSWFFGIIVDRVYDTEEIVVKPVAPLLKNLGVYSGNTILGDGSVCMIVDPNGIIARVGRIDVASSARDADARANASQATDPANQRILLVRAGSGLRKAIPLDQIARLEDIEVDQIRRSDDGRMLVQYRGSLMPLVPAASDLMLRSSGRQPVLVFTDDQAGLTSDSGQPWQMGLVVDEILDILESTARIDIESGHPDILGSAIIGDEPTEVLDTACLLGRGGAKPHYAGEFVA